MANLALLDLVLPYLFRGENLGPSHAALSALRVVTFETATDPLGITLRGHCEVNGWLDFDAATATLSGGVDEAAPVHDPANSSPIFDLRDTTIDFELFVPRAGSAIVTAAEAQTTAAAGQTLDVWHTWSAVGAPDYPSTGFTLDLIVTAPKVRPPFLHPAKVNDQGVLEPDPTVAEVKITLPRMRFRITHGNPVGAQLVLSLEAAGVSSLDDPGSPSVTEFLSMDPPHAYIGGRDGRVFGIGFRSAILDMDDDWTPPALRQKAGVGDDWTGLYLPEARIFIAPDGLRNLAFECGAQELLVGLGATGGVWGDFEAALVNQGSGEVVVAPRFVLESGRELGVVRGDLIAGVQQATVNLTGNATLLVDVRGGRTPYSRSTTINGGAALTTRAVDIAMPASGSLTIEITVTSATPAATAGRWRIVATRITEPARLPSPPTPSTAASPLPATITAQTGFTFALDQGPGEAVTVRTVPRAADLIWTPSGGVDSSPRASVSPTVAAGSAVSYAVRRPGSAGTTTLRYYFNYDAPGGDQAVNDQLSTVPAQSRTGPWEAGRQEPGAAYDARLAALPAGTALSIQGDASFEGNSSDAKKKYNVGLAWKRADRVRQLIEARYPGRFTITVLPALADPTAPTVAEADTWAAAVGWTSHVAPNDRPHWAAVVTAASSTPTLNGTVTISRPATPAVPPPRTRPPADPPPPENAPPPDWFRSAKVLVRLVDSALIAMQLDLEIDINTAAERALDNAPAGAVSSVPRGRALERGTPVGVPNESDGIIAMRVLCQVDPTTGRIRTLMSVGADPADTDGLFHFGWIPGVEPMPAQKDIPLTLLGSYLSFWPLLAAAPPVDAVRDVAEGRAGAVEHAVLAGAALAVPAAIAVLPWFAIERVILFGAEYLQVNTPDGGFTAYLLADLEMDWSVNLLDLVKIPRDRPLKVRYKAIGLELTNRDVPPGSPPGTPAPERWDFLPVFDSSRGYTIDLASGGGLQLADPLGQILRIAGARLSRSNPFTLEIDIAFGVDLGVIAVDQASVRAFLDPPGPPELTSLTARIDIPGALAGQGYLRISKLPNGDSIIGGQLDLTLRPVNVRIAAAVEVAQITEGTRQATGVYVGLNVVLPAGIPLGSTGLGIFGFRGIFGMHYRRREIGTGSGAPALRWLQAAQGQPHLLKAPGPSGEVLWEPKLDNWAFGVGILIGTMEGGVLINLDGTLLLELPGPRLLIMMNARIVSPPPSMDGLGMSGGVLAVIEITPEHFLIGVIINWEIEDLVKIMIPIEAVFPFGANAQDWHIYLGARRDYGQPVEVDVLGIVTGTGYLMMRGNGIAAFDTGHGSLPAITGFGVGLGIAASFTWGSKPAGLYLTLGGGMDAVVGFDPFILAGTIWVAGELRLWIVSIGADAALEAKVAEVDKPGGGTELSLYVHGRACGRVKFLFFSVSGCVEVTISGPEREAPIPSLVEKVSLQSRTPALIQGSATDKGIDTALGQAVESANRPDPSTLPIVPIDAIPVISMTLPPTPDGAVSIGGLGVPLTAAPGVGASGYAERSGDQYRYRITSVRLERVRADGSVDPTTLAGAAATAVWWTINSATEPSPAAALALLTAQASPATKAIEYTDRLVEDVIRRWGSVCTPAAPPAEVLWTFKFERVGPSDLGWELAGIAWPDPPGSQRSQPVDTTLQVSELWRTGDPAIDGLRGVNPALVLGGVVACERRKPTWTLPELIGIRAAGRLLSARDLSTARAAIEHLPSVTVHGARLAADDAVRSLVAPVPGSLDVALSASFHTKVTDALGSLRDLTKAAAIATPLARLIQPVETSANSLAAPAEALRSHVELDLALLRTAGPVLAQQAQAVGVGSMVTEIADATTSARCPVKVLLAPTLDHGQPTNLPDEALAKQLAAYARQDDLADVVVMHTGPYAELTLLLLVTKGHTLAPVAVRVKDASGTELHRTPVTAADEIGPGRALPAHWADLTGPWGNDVADLLTWAASTSVVPMLVSVPKSLDAATVEIGVDLKATSGQPRDYTHNYTHAQARTLSIAYAVAAIGMVSGAEVARADWDTTQIAQDRQTLTTAVGPAGTTNALLKADSTYRLVVEWHADRQGGAARGSAGSPVSQSFWFRTDRIAPDPTDQTGSGALVYTDTPAAVPVRLDPWVLVTTPDDYELGVFGAEPLQLVFNTHDTHRFFGEYGKELRVRIEAANGQHPTGTPAIPLPLPITAATVNGIPAVVGSAWQMAFDAAAAQLDGFCVARDTTVATHATLDIPIPLAPRMDYLLDVEIVPTGAPAGQRGPRVLRRHFSTGPHPSLAALAFSVGSVLPTARYAASGAFTGLLALGARPGGSAIERHLLSQGLEPMGVPDRPRVTVYWDAGSGGGLPQPLAVLIEATAPLARTRTYPEKVVDTTINPPATRWLLKPREWLSVTTGGSATVSGLVWAPGDQRVYVVLGAGSRGTTLTVDLTAPAMPDLPFMDKGLRSERLVELSLARAPWEED